MFFIQYLNKKERNGVLGFFHLLINCVYTYFLKNILLSLSFFTFLSLTTRLHPPTKIPVLNNQVFQVQNCMHDIIQVALHAVKNDTHVYYSGLNQSCRALHYLVPGLKPTYGVLHLYMDNFSTGHYSFF